LKRRQSKNNQSKDNPHLPRLKLKTNRQTLFARKSQNKNRFKRKKKLSGLLSQS